jgi:PAS domain S-box-containing protein
MSGEYIRGEPPNLGPERRVALRAAQIRQLYSQANAGVLFAGVAAFIVVALLWNAAPRERLLLWAAVFLAIQIPRLYLLRRFQLNNPQGEDALPWGRRFLAGSCSTALILGLSALVIFPEDSLPHQLLLGCVLAAFAASTATALAPLSECCTSSVLLILSPLLARFVYEGGEWGPTLAVGGLVFAGALLGTGRSINRMIEESMRLRLERDKTLDDLRLAHETLEARVEERTRRLAAKNEELIREVAERKRVEEELRASEERFRTVVETMNEAFGIQDESGRLTFVNDKLCELIGYSSEELIGEPFAAFFDETSAKELASEFARRRQGMSGSYEATLIRKDGSAVNVIIAGTAILDRDGVYRGSFGVATDITKRLEAEKALAESEANYRSLIEFAPDGIFVQVGDHIEFANPAMARLVGADSPERLQGMRVLDLVSPEFREAIDARIRMNLDEGKAVPLLAQKLVRLDGTVFYAEAAGVPIEYKGRQARQVIVRDVTERKQMEEALRESEATLRTLLQAAPVGIGQLDAERVLRWTNHLLCAMTGYSEGELCGGSARILYESEEEFIRVGKERLEGFARCGIAQSETRFKRKDGTVFDVLLSAAPLREGNGSSGVVFAALDITEAKRAQAQLRLNEERLKSLYSISQYKAESVQALLDYTLGEALKLCQSEFGYIYLYDEEKRVFELNTWSEGVMRECRVAEPQTRYELEKTGIWGEAVRQRAPIIVNDFQAPNPLKKGYPEGHVELRNFMTIPVCSGDRVVAVAGVANKETHYDEGDVRQLRLLMDSVWRIAEGVRAELAQRRSATALEHAAEGVLITDTEGVIRYVNPSLERMTGYTKDELIGENPRILKSGQQTEEFYKDLWATIKGGATWSGRFVNKRKDGTFYTEDATISPVKDASGRITSFVGVKRDVSERLDLEKQLFHAQKMEAIGTLAGGIAHDFNNLLQVILGCAEILLMKKGPGDPDRKKLEMIQQTARNGADLVSGLLTFGRKQESRRRPVNLNEVILKAEKLLRRTAPRMIEIKLVLADDLSMIDADPFQAQQALLNLAVNAVHAMPEGGTLAIETRNVSLSDQYLRSHLQAKAGRYALLVVSDTGVGMRPEVMDRIFEPFFTTKKDGEGTGLGLSMVHGIVTQHGGFVRCYSEPGRGATFKVYFPVSEQARLADLKMTREMPAFGTETILLVDDDEQVREMSRQMMEMGGYRLLTAVSGEEALEIYSAKRDEIDAVVLDLIMPGMGGRRCLEELLRINPNVKTLIASGHSSDALGSALGVTGAKGFISKPYDAKDILKALRKLLDDK